LGKQSLAFLGGIMRSILAIAALIIAVIVPAYAVDEASDQLAIPIPPGSQISMQMSMTREDILMQMDTWMQFIPKQANGTQISKAEIVEALSPLKAVQYAEMTSTTGTTVDKLVGFFEQQVPGRRIIYDIGSMPGTGILVTLTQDGGYFAAMVDLTGDKPGTGTIKAARLFGFPDVGKLVEIAMPIVINTMNSKAAAKISKPVTTKKPAPKKK
jgi:hypothetical protein